MRKSLSVLVLFLFFSAAILVAEPPVADLQGRLGVTCSDWVVPETESFVFFQHSTTTTRSIVWTSTGQKVLKDKNFKLVSGDPNRIRADYNPQTGVVKLTRIEDWPGVVDVYWTRDGRYYPCQTDPVRVTIPAPRFFGENLDHQVMFFSSKRFIQNGDKIQMELVSRASLGNKPRKFWIALTGPTGETTRAEVWADPLNGGRRFEILQFRFQATDLPPGKYDVLLETEIQGERVGSVVELFFESFKYRDDFDGPRLDSGHYDPWTDCLIFTGRFPREDGNREVLIRIGREVFTSPIFNSAPAGFDDGASWVLLIPARKLAPGSYDVGIFFPGTGLTVSAVEVLKIQNPIP
ncbi:MAG: hypothetical protein COV31_03260 [Candidatus Yanofskybacteria bacterium CG10_big_fil_rev_8_21_14_0_10_46_23]|uniref:DUF3108 domain-containing protein n=1 Tax=Candidatus Yanofskybacteria bacterium CG10_big_fil_rev_8_21_14_0_10_46_23 TaxID=1975098 RepID=A0A2H0R3N6_9BACT|nr:MAG: hypothetical protein COV31_03260 [Candidatus Yanofskybacteria bacterium CG10_big_fil_rev_8_21_14_0_10_46_23]